MKKNNLFLTALLFIFLVILISLIINFTGMAIEDISSSSCTDSDNGKNLFVKGTAKSASKTMQTDFCVVSSKIREYYCAGNGVGSILYNCLDGCSNGACNPSDKTCVDSDNGEVSNVRGKTTNLTNSKTDDCYSSTTVYEYSCSSGNVLTRKINCNPGEICSGGICKRI
ncbi:MAG: hypothetical protein AABY22_01995 [Nanoarchaeota archaeon]